MKKSNRISIDLFEDDLKLLLNSGTKIVPVLQSDIDRNLNPSDYEFGRVGNHIYRWDNGMWSYIIADDVNVNWEDIKSKPELFTPTEHTHSELHGHSNKTLLDTLKQTMINTWNTVTDKSDKSYVDTELGKKSATSHKHDSLYAVKSVEDTVAEHEGKIFNIENGYTEGHSHPSVNILNSITQLMLDKWNAVTGKADKTYVDTELDKKAEASAVSGHIGSTIIHVTQGDKDIWNAKADAFTMPTKSSLGLGNVTNVKQMPIAGGSFTGISNAHNNTSYTTPQLRNISSGTADPSGGSNGDIYFKRKV